MKKPSTAIKLRHVSFYVQDITRSLNFYKGVLGMSIYYAPNEHNVYLSNGDDVIALHSANQLRPFGPPKAIGLDHIGFFLPDAQSLMAWYVYLRETDAGYTLSSVLKHGDGCEGFYVADPDGNSIEFTTVPKSLIP